MGKLKVIESDYFDRGGNHAYGTMSKQLRMYRTKWLLLPVLKTYKINEFTIERKPEQTARERKKVVLILTTKDGRAVVEMKAKEYEKLEAQIEIHGDAKAQIIVSQVDELSARKPSKNWWRKWYFWVAGAAVLLIVASLDDSITNEPDQTTAEQESEVDKDHQRRVAEAKAIVAEENAKARANGGTARIAPRGTDLTRIIVPSDTSARYWYFDLEEQGNSTIKVSTKRQGSSGTSYARRIINCARSEWSYIKDADSWTQFVNQTEASTRWGPFVEGSISFWVAYDTCQAAGYIQ